MLESKKKPGRKPKQPVSKKELIATVSLSKTELEAEKCKRSFYYFFKQAFKVLEPRTTYVDSPIIKELCDLLQAEADRIAKGEKKKQDLIVNIPPRTSKSLIFSICFPAWVWCKYPYIRFITASYSATLSTKLALDSRFLITSDWYHTLFPDVKLADDANNKTSFENTLRGARVSTSVGGGGTGFGADIIVIDDPQNPKQAASDVIQHTVKDWYEETIYNRLNNDSVGIRIIIMQRLSQDDLSGYLLEEHFEDYNHICLPVELGDDIEVKPSHFKQYYKDNLFCPIRFPEETLNRLRSKPYRYAGQYLQKPAPSGGGLFKRESFQVISSNDFYQKFADKKIDWHFIIDSAYTDNKKNDPSAILLCTSIDNQVYIKDCKTKHLLFPDLLKFLQDYIKLHKTGNSKIYIEGKASGLSLIQQLKTLSDFSIVEMQPGKESKYVRAEGVSDFVESKRVTLIDGGYTEAFLEEVTIFPNGKNDDIVDTLVYAVKKLVTQKSSFYYRVLGT